MFKFIYRKSVNNHLMFKWKLRENSMCTLCGKEIETLEHMYFKYDIVKYFLKEIKKYIPLNFDNTFH